MLVVGLETLIYTKFVFNCRIMMIIHLIQKIEHILHKYAIYTVYIYTKRKTIN